MSAPEQPAQRPGTTRIGCAGRIPIPFGEIPEEFNGELPYMSMYFDIPTSMFKELPRDKQDKSRDLLCKFIIDQTSLFLSAALEKHRQELMDSVLPPEMKGNPNDDR